MKMVRAMLVLLLLLFVASKSHQQQHQQAPPMQQAAGKQRLQLKAEPPPGHLESMEDLELVAYLSMRNFNISDLSLLQSGSWPGSPQASLSSLAGHHQLGSTMASGPLLASASQSSEAGGPRKESAEASSQRLALMLESFIWHLRQGHLRRLKLHELRQLYLALNGSSTNPQEDAAAGRSARDLAPPAPESSSILMNISETEERCQYLVAILRHQEQQSYEEQVLPLQDADRLRRLCRLAVKCHSAEELVALISGPWRGSSPSRPARHQWEREEAGDAAATLDGRDAEQEAAARLHSQRVPVSSLRDSLSKSLAKLCPLILFQLHDDEGLCSARRDDRPPLVTVWAFATLFVTIVSFCSLIGLSITPLLGPEASTGSGSESRPPSPLSLGESGDKDNGQHQHPNRACLTLFEGLAVGSLVGSALFSLIPQAFELQERESNQGFLLKALIIFFGIYLFFCSERLMRLILDRRQQHKKQRRLLQHPSSTAAMPPAATTTVATLNSRQCRHHSQHQQQQQHPKQAGKSVNFPRPHQLEQQADIKVRRVQLRRREQLRQQQQKECSQRRKRRWMRRQSGANNLSSSSSCQASLDESSSVESLLARQHPTSCDNKTMRSAAISQPQRWPEPAAMKLEEANNSGGERHSRRRDISTVAWMIVLGDGLHNFIDGISIGAAFSESILSGVSISVAVICEEFPHELGDFAVLVSSGMTVRQALGYNFLSACTCYLGMAVGIVLGDVNDGASYISALAAGVFLYIALVDMMGELSAALEETSRQSIGQTLKLLLLQNVGIFIGISIIFILSFIDF